MWGGEALGLVVQRRLCPRAEGEYRESYSRRYVWEYDFHGHSNAALQRHVGVSGTHAFIAMGNTLGVRWASGWRTNDVDVPHACRQECFPGTGGKRKGRHARRTQFAGDGALPLQTFGSAPGATYITAKKDLRFRPRKPTTENAVGQDRSSLFSHSNCRSITTNLCLDKPCCRN